ncbi:MAG: cob(I)yrinic acid a,c-diamide adenosyltransferase [Bdellovibrionota bacterium]
MKIYTKTGDRGETGLFGGGRVSKSHPRIEAYGTVDELNAFVGWARTQADPRESGALESIQNDLFNIGAELATPEGNEKATAQAQLLKEDRVRFLETEIDRMEEKLEPLKNFVLPGGSPGAAALHVCRTVGRRAERTVVHMAASEKVRPLVIEYLNRLSDYFFVLARHLNRTSKTPDAPWKKPGE